MNFPEFKEFNKIARLSRDCIITEKIDGSNGVLYIDEQNHIFAGSRTRWLWSSEQEEVYNDNYGFAKWAKDHKEELLKLGVGFHYGEWWGGGIQRGYGLEKNDKRFSLFNTGRWVAKDTGVLIEDLKITENNKNLEYCPKCCSVVPVLYRGMFDTNIINEIITQLRVKGSRVVGGYMKPEGIVIYHTASGTMFKKTLEKDERPKSSNE